MIDKQKDFDNFKEHLFKWNEFLTKSIDKIDNEKNKGELIKKKRQKNILNNVLNAAVVNANLLIDFISPEFIKDYKMPSDANYVWMQENLDDFQKMAVKKALNTKTLCFIQGPPGTGKTTVITEICLQLLNVNPKLKILVCSETHVAVDNLIEKFNALSKKNIVKNLDCLRLYSKEDDNVVDFNLDSHVNNYIHNLHKGGVKDKVVNNILQLFKEYPDKLAKELLLNADIVGVTCNSLAKIKCSPNENFDYIIFDEVCKATLPEILIPLSMAKRAILVGDPKQLPPVFLQEEREMMDCIDNCDLQSFMYIDTFFDRLPDGHKQFLTYQYRMTNEIGSIISKFFYDNKLQNGRKLSDKGSIVWIDYNSTKKWGEKIGESPYNLDEVSITKNILKEENKNNKNKQIAVITPYKAQKKKLIDNITLSNYPNLKIDIDTVDSFQGKDADVVIFNITRTVGSTRFFSDVRRLNVALSRAKNKCYILGDSKYIKKCNILSKIYFSINKTKVII